MLLYAKQRHLGCIMAITLCYHNITLKLELIKEIKVVYWRSYESCDKENRSKKQEREGGREEGAPEKMRRVKRKMGREKKVYFPKQQTL